MCGLEFLTQGNVPETITDRGERRILVVFERSQHRRWVPGKRLAPPRGDLGAPEHLLPEGGLRHGRHRRWVLTRRALEVLALLGVARDRRFHRRPDKLIARLQIERDIASHPPIEFPIWVLSRWGQKFLIKWAKEASIINETPDVVDLGNKIEVPGSKFIFPFCAHKALVPGNGPRGQRKGAVVIVAKEIVEGLARPWRTLPGEEVVVTKRERKFAEVCRW